MAKRDSSLAWAILWGLRCTETGNFPLRWLPPQIEALAEQLEKDTGCSTIDRELFRGDMVALDEFYRTVKMHEQRSTSKAHAALERVFRRCQEFRSSLQDAVEATAPLDDLKVMLANIRRMEDAITLQTQCIRALRSPRSVGRPQAVLFETLVGNLASIYEEHTGRSAGTSTSRSRGGRGGAFVRFVKSVLDVVEPGDRHTALGENLAKMLRVMTEDRQLSHRYLQWSRVIPPDALARHERLQKRRRGKQLGR